MSLFVYYLNMTESQEYLLNAIDLIGNQTKVAELCGISQQAVSAWFKRGVPVTQAIKLEKLTDGRLKKELLAPHYF